MTNTDTPWFPTPWLIDWLSGCGSTTDAAIRVGIQNCADDSFSQPVKAVLIVDDGMGQEKARQLAIFYNGQNLLRAQNSQFWYWQFGSVFGPATYYRNCTLK